MGMLVVVVVALLLVTNVATGLAVYYLAPATPASTVQPLRVIGPWSSSEKDKFLPVLNLFKNTTGISYEYITTRQEDLQSLLPNWFAARRAPADLIFMPSSFVKTYGTQGHAADLAGTVSESNCPGSGIASRSSRPITTKSPPHGRASRRSFDKSRRTDP